MKKFLIFGAIIALVLTGCSPAKKILPKTMPTPGVFNVTYSNIELKDAPKVLKDMVDNSKGKDTASFANLDQGLYVLVTKPNGMNSDLRLKKATRTVTYAGDDQLKIDIEMALRSSTTGNQQPMVIAKLNLDDLPSTMGFEFSKKTNVPPVTPPVTPPANQNITYLTVYTPAQGATIDSPFTVTGVTKFPYGTIYVKLQDNAGNILAQTSTTADKKGNFGTLISYNPPLSPRAGKVTVSTRGPKSLHLAYIRVNIR